MKLPAEFSGRMKAQLGEPAYSHFIESLEQPVPVSVRINPSKFNAKPGLEKVAWCDSGFYLPSRPIFASDPLWHAGAYYVQEASSMIIELAFRKLRSAIQGPLKVLDLCAAPGGKSTHLASMLGDDDILVSNEVIRSRVSVLAENLTKHGYPNTIITNADSQDFAALGGIFDVVLVDAPCSGEGLFRKDPGAVDEWSPDNVNTCELRQKRILDNIIGCLKSGGYLIYSTCTYNPGENTEQVDRLAAQGFEKVPIADGDAEIQCYPHLVRGEGFYLALLRKTGDDEKVQNRITASKYKPLKPVAEISALLTTENPVFEYGENVYAIPRHVYEFYAGQMPGIPCYRVGMEVGVYKDKTFFPSEFLPFSGIFNRKALPARDLSHGEALSYLSRQALPYKSNEKGYTVMEFMGVPIGLGKYAGNRINNLFPNEWRLRKQVQAGDWFTLASQA